MNSLVSTARDAYRYVRPAVLKAVSTIAYTAVTALLDKPTSTADVTVVAQRSCPSLPLSSGRDDSVVLSRFPGKRKPAIDLSSDVSGDELSLGTLASVPCLLAKFTADSNDDPGDIIYNLPINPHNCYQLVAGDPGVTTTQMIPTHLAKATFPFCMWRGTLRFTLYWTASNFHSARFRFVIAYMANTLPTVNYPEDFPNTVFDVNGSGSQIFDVPFLFAHAFAQESIGQVAIQVVNPPGPFSGVPAAPIYFSVYVSAHPDIKVCGIADRFMVPFYLMNLDTSRLEVDKPTKVEPHWNPRSESLGRAPRAALIADFDASSFSSDSYTSVMDVIRAPEVWGFFNEGADPVPFACVLCPLPYYTAGLWTPVTTATNAIIRYGTGYPGSLVISSTRIQSSFAVNDATNTMTLFMGMLEHFSDCYKFMRGPARLKIRRCITALGGSIATSPLTATTITVRKLKLLPTTSFASSPLPFTLANIGEQQNSGPVIEETTLPGGMVEVEIPHDSPYFYAPTGGAPAGISLGIDPIYTGFPCCSIAQSGSFPAGNSHVLYRCVGDEFRFSFIKSLKPSVLVYTDNQNSVSTQSPGYYPINGQQWVYDAVDNPGATIWASIPTPYP